MKYYSTTGRSAAATFSEALIRGLAPDGGLYMPESIPVLGRSDIEGMERMSYPEIAALVINRLTGSDPGREWISSVCRQVYTFPVPLEDAGEGRFVMRLDRGPTGSFKDFAALFLARAMQKFRSAGSGRLMVLTATSGDTGSAVAQAFRGAPGVEVVILYPADEISELQRMQMTTVGQNVHAVEVAGKFDDCQELVKRVFREKPVEGIELTSANSINIGRLIPQVVYFFYAWSRVSVNGGEVIFSVPSGNFGDLMGGVIASRMGLPVRKFIVAVNDNDEFPLYLRSGRYRKVEPSRNSLSSAMNVGHPSNLARLVDLYGGRMDGGGTVIENPDLVAMRRDFASYSIDDNETRRTISMVYKQNSILLEPHGAVAWAGLERFRRESPGEATAPAVILSTAHPSKFPGIVAGETGVTPDTPPGMAPGPDPGPEVIRRVGNNYTELVHLLNEIKGSGR